MIKNYTFEDVMDKYKKINFCNNKTIEKKRKFIKILVVDDDGFDDSYLKKLGYKNIEKLFAFNNIDDFKNHDIILCDINDVAKELDPQKQGYALIEQIKKMYPFKIVLVYSTTPKNEKEQYLSKADGRIPKSISQSDLSTYLDKYTDEYLDIERKWYIIKKQLENNSFDTKAIEIVEKYLSNSLIDEKDYTNKMKKKLLSKYKKININKNDIMLISQSIIEIIKIVGVINAI